MTSTVHIAPTPSSGSAPFDALGRSPVNHFRLHFFAAVHCLSRYAGLDETSPTSDLRCIEAYLLELEGVVPSDVSIGHTMAWWDRQIGGWEHEHRGSLPLCRLLDRAGMERREAFALVLSGLVEEDSRFGSIFGRLGGSGTTARPTVQTLEVVLAVAGGGGGSRSTADVLLTGGLLRPVDDTLPRSAWCVRVPLPIWSVVRGEALPALPGIRYQARSGATPVSDLLYDAALVRRTAESADMLSRTSSHLVIRGSAGSDRLDIGRAIARALEADVLEVDAANDVLDRTLIGPLCTLAGAIPMHVFDPAPGETATFEVLAGYNGPMIGVLASGGLKGSAMDRSVVLEVPPLSPDERHRRWESEFLGFRVPEIERINRTFLLPGLHLRRVARSAARRARAEGRQEVDITDVRHAARTLNREMLETLADRIEVSGSWDTLIVSDYAGVRLRELAQRCRHREGLEAHVGRAFAGNLGPGVRALFTGPSGTGKTLAARVLAASLEMDLYRVDLAAVINKYIGETEKNLHRVLSRAEELDVILLLDEGDALLGSRTEVRSANDRYANLETNYLLQRLEHYRGIVLVTTNLARNIDRAFQRRMDLVVEFSPPGPEERLQIWLLHLPEHHRVSPGLLESVAMRYPLSGGQIRNAALHAALMARESEQPVSEAFLLKALESEYRKAGSARLPHETVRPSDSGMQSFIHRLRK
jgi:hypothetical protein